MGKEQDLRTAAGKGDVPAILKSLTEGVDVNCKGSNVSAVCLSSFFLSLSFLSSILLVEFGKASGQLHLSFYHR